MSLSGTVPPRKLNRSAFFTALISVGVIIVVWINAPSFVPSDGPAPSDEVFYGRAMCRLTVLLVGTFVAAFALIPAATASINSLRRSWSSTWIVLALIAACVFQWFFILHYGRWQFGAFDSGNLMQEGWREFLGQRPYTDFLATTPPAFNLGIKYAYQLFGVSWDASLYLTALFTCVTFLWLYWLFARLDLGRTASLSMALSIECAAMLTLSFWWYNNITTILAAVLFLSSLVYLAQPRSIPAQLSFVLSLSVTSLTKPNMAGITIVSCIAMLLFAVNRLRTLLLTAGAAAIAVGILAFNRISIPALLHSYRSVAGERGFGSIGFSQMNTYEQVSSFFWIPLLSIPLFALAPRILAQLKQWAWQSAVLSLFYFLGAALAIYGVATNGELRQVECTLLIASGAVVAFGLRLNRPVVTRIYIALLIASTAGDLYLAAQRLRVYDGGVHTFFEWQDNRNVIVSGPLKNMRVSSTLIGVEAQIQTSLTHEPGPFWFGPRLDFNNAIFHQPMPLNFPAWWHPGTAFSRSEVPHLLDLWQQQHYQTLIFLRGDPRLDYIYYPQPFLDLIHRDYIADDTHPSLTIYCLRKSNPLHP